MTQETPLVTLSQGIIRARREGYSPNAILGLIARLEEELDRMAREELARRALEEARA